MKTILILILIITLQGCFEEDCDKKYLYGYETVTSKDGSSTTTKAIYKCGEPVT